MSPTKLSKYESAMRVVLAFNDAFNRHDVEGMMAHMSKDCVFENSHPAPNGSAYIGKDKVAQFWRGFFSQSPQAQIEIEEIFGFGERCVMRWRYSWVDSDGEEGHVRGVDVFRVKRESIQEKFSYVKG